MKTALLAALFVVLASGPAAAAPHEQSFGLREPSEVVAFVMVECDPCAWDESGREAVVLLVQVDGQYSQHLPVVRRDRMVYPLMLGPLPAGRHMVRVDEDPKLTASQLRGGDHARVISIGFEIITPSQPRYRPVSHAPIVHARPDTIGRFTDVPVFMWYEEEPTARGMRYRYSVIFTNEDGGTPADRLMATWGRTTDIEYVYSVEVNAAGEILDEDIQGPKHEILKFAGQRHGRHPLLWVVTENNMVLDRGVTSVRYAPAPGEFPLREVSREAVMDRHPWLYDLAAQELIREGKLDAYAQPGDGKIPDPRQFVYLEGCGALGGGALAFAIRVKGEWMASDRGMPEYRIARDGCFRAAIPVPVAAGPRDVQALRAHAYTRPPSGNTPRPAVTAMRLTRINRVFMLDDRYRPGASFMQWSGELPLMPDGPPVEIPVKR